MVEFLEEVLLEVLNDLDVSGTQPGGQADRLAGLEPDRDAAREEVRYTTICCGGAGTCGAAVEAGRYTTAPGVAGLDDCGAGVVDCGLDGGA